MLLSGRDILWLGSQESSAGTITGRILAAADFAHFRKAALAETPLPADLRALPGPVIGLVGMLDKHFDLEMLGRLAECHPERSIALVGPVWANLDTAPLCVGPNVHLLGGKSVAELPRYIKGFDVCLIPYVLDDFTRDIYPAKPHEYLASGKPIVAPRMPPFAEYEGLARIADDPAVFVGAVEAAVAEQNPALGARRIDLARVNTWDQHVAAKSQLVRAALSSAQASWGR